MNNDTRVKVTETQRKKCKPNAGKLPHFEKGDDFYTSMGLKKKQSISIILKIIKIVTPKCNRRLFLTLQAYPQ